MMFGENNDPYGYHRGLRYGAGNSLASGVDFTGTNPVSAGFDSMTHSLSAIAQDKVANEEKKQADFNNLIDVSLKGIYGKYRDEAVQKRDAFIKSARDLAMKNKGNFTWEQTKNLENQKSDLNNFSGMYQEVQDWSKKAYTQAMSISDPEARNATVKNINSILQNSPDLKTTWQATNNTSNWLVLPKKKFDLVKTVLPRIPNTLNPDGTQNIEGYKKAIRSLINIKDGNVTGYMNEWKQENPNGTDEQFVNNLAETKKQYVQSKYNPFVIPNPSNGGRNAKGQYYNYNGQLYRKGDARPVIKPTKDGSFLLGSNAIKLNSWQDKKGNNYSNAKVISVKNVKGKWMAVIEHSRYSVDKEKTAFIAKNGQAAWDAEVAAHLKKNAPKRKDNVMNAVETVPLDKVYNLISRSLILKDIKYNRAVDMEGLNNVKPANTTPKDVNDPLALKFDNTKNYKKEVSN